MLVLYLISWSKKKQLPYSIERTDKQLSLFNQSEGYKKYLLVTKIYKIVIIVLLALIALSGVGFAYFEAKDINIALGVGAFYFLVLAIIFTVVMFIISNQTGAFLIERCYCKLCGKNTEIADAKLLDTQTISTVQKQKNRQFVNTTTKYIYNITRHCEDCNNTWESVEQGAPHLAQAPKTVVHVENLHVPQEEKFVYCSHCSSKNRYSSLKCESCNGNLLKE